MVNGVNRDIIEFGLLESGFVGLVHPAEFGRDFVNDFDPVTNIFCSQIFDEVAPNKPSSAKYQARRSRVRVSR